MPVELEQVKEGLYFKYKGNVIRIQEVHFPFLPVMRHALEPIALDRNEFFMLSFQYARDEKYGELKKETETGKLFWVKKNSKNSGWIMGIGLADTGVELHFVHQLQDIYLAIFNEVLRRRGDEPTPPEKHQYRLMPNRSTSVKIDEDGPEEANTYNEVIPYQEQLYYLTWDCCYLIRNIQYTIWKVTEPKEDKGALFEYFGRKWGLLLLAGKGTTERDMHAAGKWMQNHLAENSIKAR